MYCHNCGNKLADNSNFCDKCGTKVNHLNTVTNTSNTTSGTNPFAEPGSTVPRTNPFAGTESTYATSNSDSQNLIYKFTGAGMMFLSLVFVLFNVGGFLSGFKLIEALFKMSSKFQYMSGGDSAACILLLVSHLGIIFCGGAGLIIFLNGKGATISSVMVIVAGVLGAISGMITGWNVVAETMPIIFGIIAVIMSMNMHDQTEE